MVTTLQLMSMKATKFVISRLRIHRVKTSKVSKYTKIVMIKVKKLKSYLNDVLYFIFHVIL